MANNKLSELAVRQAKPSKKQRKLFDGDGLFLLVHPNGSKYWRLKYRSFGKEKLFALGVSPKVSLTTARKEAQRARDIIKQGKDPVQLKRLKALESKTEQQNTFDAIPEDWLNRKTPEWTEKQSFDVRRSLELHVLPDLSDRPINQIDSPELLQVLRKIEDQGKHEAVHRARQRCVAVFRYVITI